MNRHLYRIWAAFLICCLLMGAVSAAFQVKTEDQLLLGDGTVLKSGFLQQTESGSAVTAENYVRYTPQRAIRPVVAYGNTMYGRSDMQYVVKYLTENKLSMVAGVNGAFFDPSTGIPFGPVVTGGILRACSAGNAVGFFKDGSAILGDPGMKLQITFDGGTVSPHYNKTLTVSNGSILYSSDYDYRTKNTVSAYHVVLRPVENDGKAELTLEDSVRAEVIGMVAGTSTCSIPEDGFLLAMAEETEYPGTLEKLKSLQMGDIVEIKTTCDADWADVEYACGAGDWLVQDGQAAESFTLDSANYRRARTAVGVCKNGDLVFYTADQTKNSAGMTLSELAERMQALGCVEALNLDGGGSTTLGAQYPGYTTGATVNDPSDGQLCACANFIFLVRQATEAGDAEHLYLYPYKGYVLPGARLKMTVKAADGNYMASEVPVRLSYEGTNAEVTSDGILTVASQLPEGDRTASVTVRSGDLSATTEFTVLQKVSGVSVLREDEKAEVKTLHLPGKTVVGLKASANFRGAEVYASDSSFQWSVTGNIGTVDQLGTFTAANTDQQITGTIVCSYGGASSSVSVTVSPADPFADVKNHWAAEYINSLYFDGTIQGSAGANGKLYYRPDDDMTRQEFVVALMRFLGTDLTKYDQTELPFADNGKIADWALPAMKAAYALGYMGGSRSGDALYANPTSTVTRQEAMTILARSQKLEKKNSMALSVFVDEEQVADWARAALSAMVEKGIISGTNGKLMPTGKVTRAQVAKMLYKISKG